MVFLLATATIPTGNPTGARDRVAPIAAAGAASPHGIPGPLRATEPAKLYSARRILDTASLQCPDCVCSRQAPSLAANAGGSSWCGRAERTVRRLPGIAGSGESTHAGHESSPRSATRRPDASPAPGAPAAISRAPARIHGSSSGPVQDDFTSVDFTECLRRPFHRPLLQIHIAFGLDRQDNLPVFQQALQAIDALVVAPVQVVGNAQQRNE